MSDLHEHSDKDSSIGKLILIAVVILALLYFLAKGCTNRPENEGAPGSHGTGMIVSPDRPFTAS